MKKFIVLLVIVLILSLIVYFIVAPDDGGSFSTPAQREKAVRGARDNGAVKVI